jgi:hypothetical protein
VDREHGGLRLTPFVSVQNLFDRSYVGSVTIQRHLWSGV